MYCCLWQSVVGHSYITLSVKVCKEAYFLISEVVGVSIGNVYEIYLSNDKAEIRQNIGGIVLQTAFPGRLLRCSGQYVLEIDFLIICIGHMN